MNHFKTLKASNSKFTSAFSPITIQFSFILSITFIILGLNPFFNLLRSLLSMKGDVMPKKIIQLILFLLLPMFIQLNALPMVSKSGNIAFSLIMFVAILYVLIRITKIYNLPLIRKKFDWQTLLITISLTAICEAISLLFNYLNQLVTKVQPDPLISTRLSDKSIWVIIVTMLTINITGPILEELAMRGIIYQYSASIFNSRITGAVISSIVFAFFHDEGIILSINYFITSIFLTIIFEKTKNIYSNILSHQLLNIMSTILFFI